VPPSTWIDDRGAFKCGSVHHIEPPNDVGARDGSSMPVAALVSLAPALVSSLYAFAGVLLANAKFPMSRRFAFRRPCMIGAALSLAAFACVLATACGTSTGPSPNGAIQCPAGMSFCNPCGKAGLCTASACSSFRCLAPDGGSEGGVDGCGAGESACVGCDGAMFCSAGPCPGLFCSPRDGGPDAALDGAAGCRKQADCASPAQCSSPVAALPAPSLPLPNLGGSSGCDADVDCAPDGGNRVCSAICGGNCSNVCESGCADGAFACPAGSTCAASHRCEPAACSSAAPCPALFDCTQGTCTRRTCSTDGDCGSAYCVLGQCASTLGLCVDPAG
jgi:hypothetical protein